MGAGACSSKPVADADQWQVFALAYGESQGFRHSVAVRGAPKGERIPFAWYAWLLRKGEQTILVDTGFDDQEKVRSWRLTRHTTPRALLETIGIKPASVNDLVITHAHWDHVGDVGSYPKARIWMQKAEYEWAVGRVSEENPERSGVRLQDVNALKAANRERRLQRIEGDREIVPGVTLHLGGRHTKATQWVSVKTGGPEGTVVLATDIAYLYENVDTLTPGGSTGDPEGDIRQLEKMRKTATRPDRIIPGHDPRVAEGFKAVKPHIHRIE